MSCGFLDTSTIVAVFAGGYVLGMFATFAVFFVCHNMEVFGENDDAAK
jgi:hypothetical protein